MMGNPPLQLTHSCRPTCNIRDILSVKSWLSSHSGMGKEERVEEMEKALWYRFMARWALLLPAARSSGPWFPFCRVFSPCWVFLHYWGMENEGRSHVYKLVSLSGTLRGGQFGDGDTETLSGTVLNKVTVSLDEICWVITRWIAHSTVASESSSPFEFRFAAKQEWPNGDEERVECAIHFVITHHIPSKLTVTLVLNVCLQPQQTA